MLNKTLNLGKQNKLFYYDQFNKLQTQNSFSIKQILQLRGEDPKSVANIVFPLCNNQLKKMDKLLIEAPIENDIKYLNEYCRLRNRITQFLANPFEDQTNMHLYSDQFLSLKHILCDDTILLSRCLKERSKTRDKLINLNMFLDQTLQSYHQMLNNMNILLDSYSISIENEQNNKNISENKIMKKKSKGTNLNNLIENVLIDMESLSIEKFGAAPNMELKCKKSDLKYQNLDEMVYFIISEIVKNSVQSISKRYGAMEFSEKAFVEIDIHHNKKNNLIHVEISDNGNSIEDVDRIFEFFYSTAEERPATYAYSQAFGETKEGFGVGTSVSRVLARNLGGDLTLLNSAENKKTFLFTFSKDASHILTF